jgi:hypothetical protein
MHTVNVTHILENGQQNCDVMHQLLHYLRPLGNKNFNVSKKFYVSHYTSPVLFANSGKQHDAGTFLFPGQASMRYQSS